MSARKTAPHPAERSRRWANEQALLRQYSAWFVAIGVPLPDHLRAAIAKARGGK